MSCDLKSAKGLCIISARSITFLILQNDYDRRTKSGKIIRAWFSRITCKLILYVEKIELIIYPGAQNFNLDMNGGQIVLVWFNCYKACSKLFNAIQSCESQIWGCQMRMILKGISDLIRSESTCFCVTSMIL